MIYKNNIITGLRGWAIIFVLTYHSFPHVNITRIGLSGGFIGVDVFFVISGYLIFGMLDVLNGKKNILIFIMSRFIRLMPSLLLIITVTLIFGYFVLLPDEYKLLALHGLNSQIFWLNFQLINENSYFETTSKLKILLHLWSLSIEIQLYILLILITLANRKLRNNYFIHFIFLLSILYCIYLTNENYEINKNFYSPLSRVWEFIFGVYAYIYKKDINIILTKYCINSKLIRTIGIFILLISVLLINDSYTYPGYLALLPVIGTSLIIICTNESYQDIIFTNKYLLLIGNISYPLYLWHWPLLVYLNIINGETASYYYRLLAILISFFLALITFNYIEKPLRNISNKFYCFIILIIFSFILSVFCFVIYKENGMPLRSVAIDNIAKESEITKDIFEKINEYKANVKSEEPCSFSENIRYLKYISKCEVQNGNGKDTIVLWGDSYASMWNPVFSKIAKENNLKMITISHFSCPPILNVKKIKIPREELKKYCNDGNMQIEAINWLKSFNPKLIILTSAWNSYSEYGGRDDFVTDKSKNYEDYNTTNYVIKNNLPNTINKLRSDIDNILIMGSIPLLEKNPWYQIKRLSFLVDRNAGNYVTKQNFIKENSQIDNLFNDMKNDKINYFLPSDFLCENELCIIKFDDVKLYSNSYHLSIDGVFFYYKELNYIVKNVIYNYN